MYRIPQEIDYGIVRALEYVPDYGRFEARVALHFTGGEIARAPISVLASVPARENERFEDLRLRLVLKAARLLRLVEVEESSEDHPDPQQPLAA